MEGGREERRGDRENEEGHTHIGTICPGINKTIITNNSRVDKALLNIVPSRPALHHPTRQSATKYNLVPNLSTGYVKPMHCGRSEVI